MAVPETAPSKSSNEKDNHHPGAIVKRRNRIPQSCEPCRIKKLKCDRQKPCQNCKARNIQQTCAYAAREPQKIGEMGTRLKRLEAMVSSLVRAPTRPKSSPDQALSGIDGDGSAYPSADSALEPATPYGTMVVASEGQHYIGESHWEAILRDIAAIKEDLGEISKPRISMCLESDQPALLGGVLRTVTKPELMESFPSKPVADLLVARFFESYDPAIPGPSFVHKSTFLKHYEHYWNDLDSTPLTKLGVLFAVFCLALQSYQRYGDEPLELNGYSDEMSDVFRHRAAQCILAADITAPAHDSIPCLMLYGMCEYSRLPHGDISLWMIQATLVRKGMLMGYHRDPDCFPSISPFEGEMRRRLWHGICQLDLLLSFQLGLPSMIQYTETDVAPPRSVFEEELYEEMTELPPSRPMTEPTPVSYFVAKHRLFQAFGRVVQHLNLIKIPSDSEVLELNRLLADAHADIPPHLRMRPWEQSLGDPRTIQLQRMQLQGFYDKAVCILNRRFIAIPSGHPRFSQSRALCVESALSLLSIQAVLHQMRVKWYLFSLSRNDFLLATVIICLVLNTGDRGRHKYDASITPKPTQTEDYQLRLALKKAHDIWKEIAKSSLDARKACSVIEAMLVKLKPERKARPDVTPSSDPETLASDSVEDVQAAMVDWTSWDSVIHGNNYDVLNNFDELWSV